MQKFGALIAAHLDSDDDGLSNIQEFFLNSDPTSEDIDGDGLSDFIDPVPSDYFNGSTPSLVKVSGDNQEAVPNQFNAAPLEIAAWNITATEPLFGAPVTFQVTVGGGQVSASSNGTEVSSLLTTTTDVEGRAKAYFKQPLTASTSSSIAVTAGTAQLVFNTNSSASSSIEDDTDQNGLPDTWERQHFGQIGVDSVADADGDGRTNLQEYHDGTSPGDAFNGRELRVIPKLSPIGRMLSSGKLRVWVGFSDGQPLRNADLTVKALGQQNLLTDGTATFRQITIHTDANGIAEIFLTPNPDPDDDGEGGNDEPLG